MFCSRCGSEISAEAKYCPKCGWCLSASSDSDITDEWFYIDNSNVRCGPFPPANIHTLVQQRKIRMETLVWKKGMLNWLPAGKCELVHIIKTVVPTVPISIVSNKYAWALATVPICISWILALTGLPSWVVTICTISLNVIFAILDSDEIKKSGSSVSGWIWTGIMVVPAYLFVRASKTNKKYGYAIMWCVMFLLDLVM